MPTKGTFITTSDGTEIYLATWEPAGKLVATVTAIHGLGEHIGRYEHVFTNWAAKGIRVRGIDQRGFGRTVRGRAADWKSTPGHAGLIENTVRDIRAATKPQRAPGVPHFVFGHSMGGLLALAWASMHPDEMDGVISSAPALETSFNPALKFAVVCAAAALPSMAIPNLLDLNNLSHSVEVRNAYVEDPFTHPYLSFLTAKSSLTWAEKLLGPNSKTFCVPILLTHGSADHLTLPSGSQKFFERIAVKDKSFDIFDGLFHECHNEPDKQNDVIALWRDWILARSKQ